MTETLRHRAVADKATKPSPFGLTQRRSDLAGWADSGKTRFLSARFSLLPSERVWLDLINISVGLVFATEKLFRGGIVCQCLGTVLVPLFARMITVTAKQIRIRDHRVVLVLEVFGKLPCETDIEIMVTP